MRKFNRKLPRVPITGYGRGTQRQVLKSKTFSGMLLGIGSGQPNKVCVFAPVDSIVRTSIPCLGAVETKPTARTTNSRVILLTVYRPGRLRSVCRLRFLSQYCGDGRFCLSRGGKGSQRVFSLCDLRVSGLDIRLAPIHQSPSKQTWNVNCYWAEVHHPIPGRQSG
jgi:hypothetical protein